MVSSTSFGYHHSKFVIKQGFHWCSGSLYQIGTFCGIPVPIQWYQNIEKRCTYFSYQSLRLIPLDHYIPLVMPRSRDKCDSVVMDAISWCGCTKHGTCPKKPSRGRKPCEMKGSRIKSIIATITASRPGVDKVTILNQALEDNKEYFVCSTFARLIKKEEEALAEEERKRKGEEKEKPSPERRSLQIESILNRIDINIDLK